MATKYLLAEQALTRITGGYPPVASATQIRDMYPAINQIINNLLKVQQFNINMPQGETIPENLLIGIYNSVAVTSVSGGIGKSKATLPVIPVSLPRNMGIVQIYDPAYPDSPFIPIQVGQRALLKTDSLLSDLMGQVSYEPKGSTIYFNKDLPLYGINSVTMELAVFNISQYAETDILPIPADMEADIITALMQQFSPVIPEDATINPFTTLGQQPILTKQPNR